MGNGISSTLSEIESKRSHKYPEMFLQRPKTFATNLPISGFRGSNKISFSEEKDDTLIAQREETVPDNENGEQRDNL